MKRQFLHSNTNCPVLSTRYLVLGIIFSLFCVSKTYSNNLQVSSLTYDVSAGTVTFNVSWDNSWRNSTSNPHTSPNNFDAAWIFVKFRDCLADNSVQFTHGLISPSVGDHTFPVTLEPAKRDGTSGIDASASNTGVMLRSTTSSSSNFSIASATVTLKLSNLPTIGSFDMRVFGIEMVFVPQGAFAAGDGSGTNSSGQSFTNNPNSASPNIGPVSISSENAQSVYDRSTAICPGNTCALTAAFPKGYNAYYIMKYEISQGEYVDFLNTITNLAQLVRYPNKNGTNRHTISNTGTAPLIYTSVVSSVSKDDRACNFLSWGDVGAYLDWAALRPLTELEFEKACRGPLQPLLFEKAWGAATGTAPATTTNVAENGTEVNTATTANINSNSITFASPADAGQGPVRCGIFATATNNTRLLTGAGFYGAMELSGNVFEYYVCTVSGVSGNVSSTGVDFGDGVLDPSSGNHNTANWPDSYAPATNNIIRRGGSWSGTGTTAASQAANVSFRSSGSTATRDNLSGGRGGR